MRDLNICEFGIDWRFWNQYPRDGCILYIFTFSVMDGIIVCVCVCVYLAGQGYIVLVLIISCHLRHIFSTHCNSNIYLFGKY